MEIIFTSGTTAEPRGVVISHGNVLANIEPVEREIQKYLRYERIFHPLRFLNLLPLSHVFGQMLGIFIPPFLAGTVVFIDSLKPSGLIDVIRDERISVLVAVPRFIESLQREIQRQMERDGRRRAIQRKLCARREGTFSAALVAIPANPFASGLEILGVHFRRGRAARTGGNVLESPGLRRDSGIWHDRNYFAHQPESSVPFRERFDWQSFSGHGSSC